MKQVITRTLTGIVFIALVIGSVLVHSAAFALVMLLFLFIAVSELMLLLKKSSIHLSPPLIYTGAFTMFLSIISIHFFQDYFILFWPFLLTSILMIPILEMFRNQENSLKNSAITLFSIFYLAVPMSSLVLLYGLHPESKTLYIVALFSIIWAYDTLAYCCGMLFGKHKLCEKISPKKTWEGLIGGTILTLILLFFANRLFVQMDDIKAIGAGVVIIFFSTFGDMFESVLKRKADVKDSGTLFPGHGGVLDRFDSVFFATIPFILYLFLVVR